MADSNHGKFKSFGSVAAKIAAQLVILVICLPLLLEPTLRFMPDLIPLEVLMEFQPDLRQSIAQRLGLQTNADMVRIDRDDGGVLLQVYKPHAAVKMDFNDPGMITTMNMDKQGFCNDDQIWDLPEIPVVVLGDSITWCTNVKAEDAWPKRLAAGINKPVLSLATPGVGVYEYVQILKQRGAAKSPKYALLSFFEGNDIRDAIVHANNSTQKLVGTAENECRNRNWLVCKTSKVLRSSPIVNSSYAMSTLVHGSRVLARNIRQRSQMTSAATHVAENQAGAPTTSASTLNFRYQVRAGSDEVALNARNGDVDELMLAQSLYADQIDLNIYKSALIDFVRFSKAKNIEPIVVYIPAGYTAYRASATFADPAVKPVMESYSDKQRQALAQFAAEIGYQFWDATPYLQKAAAASSKSSLLYYPSNVHLSPHGHQVLANFVREKFSQQSANF